MPIEPDYRRIEYRGQCCEIERVNGKWTARLPKVKGQKYRETSWPLETEMEALEWLQKQIDERLTKSEAR